MDKKTAISFIQKQATEKIPPEEQARFAELLETELMGLHEGNIARYRLRPSEFKAWQASWR